MTNKLTTGEYTMTKETLKVQFIYLDFNVIHAKLF